MEPLEEQPIVSVHDISPYGKPGKDEESTHKEERTYELDNLGLKNLLTRLEAAPDKVSEAKIILKEVLAIKQTNRESRLPLLVYFLQHQKLKLKELVDKLTEAAKPRTAIQLKELASFVHEKMRFRTYQPTEDDLNTMCNAGMDRVHALRQLSLSEFVTLHLGQKSMNDGGKDGVLFKNLITTAEFDDQDKRAREVAKVIHEKKQQTQPEEKVRLVLLDGHGRMVFLILKHLLYDFEFNIDEHLVVCLVDIDPLTNDFHDVFLPYPIQIVRGSLLDFPLTMRDVVYANFCSIPSLSDDAVKDQFTSYLNMKDGLVCCKESVLYWALYVTAQRHIPLFISFIAATGPARTQYVMATGVEDKSLTALGLQSSLLNSRLFAGNPRLIASRALMVGDKFIQSADGRPVTLKTKIQHSGVFVTVYLPAAPATASYHESRARLDLYLLHAGLKHHHPEFAPGSTFQAIHGGASDELVTFTVVKRYLNMVDVKCDHPTCKRKKISCEKKKQWKLSDILLLLDPSAPLFEIRL